MSKKYICIENVLTEEQLTNIEHSVSAFDLMVASVSIAFAMAECSLPEWAIKLSVTQYQEAYNNAKRQIAMGIGVCPYTKRTYQEICVDAAMKMGNEEMVKKVQQLLTNISAVLTSNQQLCQAIDTLRIEGYFPVNFFINGGSFICEFNRTI